jgi:hypothetical protein
MQDNNQDDDKPLGFFELLGSAFAALIGISSQAKRERDFKKMKPHHFLIAGLMLMTLFFGTVIIITRTLLATH